MNYFVPLNFPSKEYFFNLLQDFNLPETKKEAPKPMPSKLLDGSLKLQK